MTTETGNFGTAYPVELLEPFEMAEADRLTHASVPSSILMERAGKAVAEAAITLLRTCARRRVLVLCGPGNNGGDGYVAARLLAQAGCEVTLATIVPRETLKGDAALASALWKGPVVSGVEAAPDLHDLVVDALVGAGLSRDIDGEARAIVEKINDWSRREMCPVLAVDMPSGVDGSSGAVRGVAIEASATVTFFRLKPGHVLMPGRVHCGSVTLADIGIKAATLASINPQTSLNVPKLWSWTLRRPTLEGHKYGRGHAVVVSGPVAHTGAARLAARGALRSGAGLVTVATPGDALLVNATALTAVMTRVVDDADGLRVLLADPRKNAIALGPGLGVGPGTRALVLAALAPAETEAPPRAIVLDADALVSFADDSQLLFAAIAKGGHVVVLTPHDGEFAKLFGGSLDVLQAKPKRARQAAALSGAVVLLKGPDTTVAHPDGRASIARSEAPWLATAGSGDVLAGMVVGLLAQAMPVFEAASAAVWIHAEAARRFGPGLISEDIPDRLPEVLRELFKSV